MCSKIERGVLTALAVVVIANTVLLEKVRSKVDALEPRYKGTVEAFLEPLPEGNLNTTMEYKGPTLYRNGTKIVLHDAKEFTCLAENVFFESGHQPYIGKIAVLQTVFNRAESGKWGYSFCDVIHADKQFSWTLNEQKKPYGSAWKASKDAVRAFLSGVRVKNISTTDHYHANYVSPKWKESMKQTAIIGDHVFYASK